VFFNDVVVEPGGQSVLVTDMGDLPAMFAPDGSFWPLESREARDVKPRGRIYRVTLDGKASLVIDHAKEMPNPNGVDELPDGTILIGEFFRGTLLAWRDGRMRELCGGHRGVDGIVHDAAGKNLYLTEVRSGKVWHIQPGTGEHRLLATLQSAADQWLDEPGRILVVPDSKAGQIVFIPL
jgi:sugar lactone lactonase YvrE